MRNKIIFTISLVFFYAEFFSQPTFIKDSLDRYIEREMKRWQIPGLAISITADTQVIYMKGFGYADVEKKKKVNESTLFQIASNSKAFTATALAILETQHKLSIRDKATKWLPYFSLKEDYPSRHSTVADLLCHRIGFSTFQSDFLNWGCNLSRKEIIEHMRNVTPNYSFRERFGYCNSAFLAAGEIIPAVCDTSWDDYLRYRFFLPLGMTRSSTQFSKIEEDDNACLPYTIYEGKLFRLPRVNVNNLGPAASVNSCVKDLSNWLIAQVNNGKFGSQQVLPEKALLRTREPFMLVSGGDEASKNYFEAYGLGWFMKDYHGTKVIWHDGGADGFVTTTCFLPEQKIGITVLTNTDASGFYGNLRDMIIDAFLNLPYTNYSAESFARSQVHTRLEQEKISKWREQAEKKEPFKPGLKKMEGEYRNEVYGKITIRSAANGQLMILFEHHPLLSATLDYMGNDQFLCTYSNPTYGIKVADVKIEKEKVKGIVLRVNAFLDFGEYLFQKQ